MARVHVLDTQGDATRVVLHVPVPAGTNASGIAWTAALKASLSPTAPVSVLPDGTGTGGTVSAAEKTDLTNGVAYEVVDRTPVPAGMGAAQANAFLDALHAAKQAEVQPQLQAKLNYWGYTRV